MSQRQRQVQHHEAEYFCLTTPFTAASPYCRHYCFLYICHIVDEWRQGRRQGRRSTRRSEVPAEATSLRAPSSSLSSTRSAHCTSAHTCHRDL